MTKDSTTGSWDAGPPPAETPAARKKRREAMPMHGGDPARSDLQALAAQLAERAREEGVAFGGPDGVIAAVTKMLLDTGLDTELTAHLGYEWHGADGDGNGNRRNGHKKKKVKTGNGLVEVEIPKDRNASFDPQLVPKGARRVDGFDDQILALYAGGMTQGEIQAYLAKLYKMPVSHELISQVTDSIVEQMGEWQNRPLEHMYPVLFIDAVHVKIREGTVASRPVYIAVAIDMEGRRQVLGLWSTPGTGGEGKANWTNVLGEIKNRGVGDVLIACCDGLEGLADAIRFTWPEAQVQRCIVHLKRATFRFIPIKETKEVAAALKPITDAPTIDAAAARLEEFEAVYGDRFPGAVRVWRDAWDEFVPFLTLPREIRHMIYSTNMIESLNARVRTSVNRHGHFPSDVAAKKLIYLVLQDHGPWNDRRDRNAPAKKISNWKVCLNALVGHFGDRLTTN